MVSVRAFGLQLLLILCIVFNSGCSKTQSRDGIDPKPSVRASANILKSFESPMQASESHRGKFLVIKKTALEKEFLLQTQLISQAEAPNFEGLRSRVVSFRYRGDKIYMLEASQGHSVSADLPQSLIIAEFPVIEEAEDNIAFDFNKGMSNIFISGEWHASDFDGNFYEPNDTSVKTKFSYIEDIEFKNEKTLVIRQIAQLEAPMGKLVWSAPIEVKYYVEPYEPDTEFVPVKWQDNIKLMGFFEASPILGKNGQPVTFLSRFHQDKPIVFAVSSNTPDAFKQAVRDGVLYWSKVLGPNRIQAIDAPVGVTAPDLNHNVIQWVNHDSAGFAYADVQLDPRSGQVLHAQVFFTSTFAKVGSVTGQRLLFDGLESSKSLKRRLGLEHFKSSRLCVRHFEEQWDKTLTALEQNQAGEAQILKAAQDMVRSVVAHEVGHTLGLRHNFAGSLGIDFPLTKLDEIFKSYLNGATVEVTGASTVMDYLPNEIEILIGSRIAQPNSAALEYDQKAISSLYKGEFLQNSQDVPAFCTDSHLGTYTLGCGLFDMGASPIEFAVYGFEKKLKDAPLDLLDEFIRRKTPIYAEQPLSVEEFSPRPDYVVRALAGFRKTILMGFMNNASYLPVRRHFPAKGSIFKKKIRSAEADAFLKEIDQLGGIEKTMVMIPEGYGLKAFEKFEALLKQPQLLSGTGYGGRKYSFTESEIETMRATAKLYFTSLEEEALKDEIEGLATNPGSSNYGSSWMSTSSSMKIIDHELTQRLAKVLAAKTLEVAFATVQSSSGIPYEYEITEKNEKIKVVVDLPTFKYPFELRVRAINMLKPERGEKLSWSREQLTEVKKVAFELLKKYLGKTATYEIRPDEMPKESAQWAREFKAVIEAIDRSI